MPVDSAFVIAAFTGLRVGEIEGLHWEDFRDGEINVSRSIWNGRETEPKTRKSAAPVPAIPLLAEQLEMHRLRSKNAKSGPIFATGKKTELSINNLLRRVILAALNRGAVCRVSEQDHESNEHKHQLNDAIPEGRGCHACRRGLGSNLYRLGVRDVVIQRILRHADVSTSRGYYIKTMDDDVKEAMAKIEKSVQKPTLDTAWTPAGLKQGLSN